MGGGEGNKGGYNKGDDAENMCGSSLEPDSRYDACCSSIFRPGRILRDLIVGFLVVLGIAVVIAVLFVVCIFFVPSDEQKETGDLLGKGEALSDPRELEKNLNVVDEIDIIVYPGLDPEAELTGVSTRYETDKGRLDLPKHEHGNELEHDHDVHLEPETEPEAESEPEPEPESEPEPEPESESEPEPKTEPETEPEHEFDHEHVPHHHNHGSDQGEHDHSHSDHDHADHIHEHPNHHMEHPDHDDIPHVSIEEGPAEPKGNMEHVEHIDGHMDPHHIGQISDMDHNVQMDYIDQMENTGHMGHMENVEQMDQNSHVDPIDKIEHGVNMPNGDQVVHGEHVTQDGGHHIAIVDHHQPQVDLVMLEEHQPEFGGSCRPRSLEMCSDMPYASTMLPNWVNDQNSEDLLNVSLPYFRDIIVRSSCSPRARSFACAVLEPPCVMDTSGQDTILPPCRSFCRSVGTTCAEFIISGLALSEVFECDRFPDSTDPSVCFDMSQGPCVGVEHQCGDGRCVARGVICDGVADCADRSDEALASCTDPRPSTEFSRFSQSAVPVSEPFETATTIEFASEPQDFFGFSTFTPLEDLPQPFDQTTEVGFDEPTTFSLFDVVPPSDCELTCLDGTCITAEQLNNGVSDCPDGTDEKNMSK